MSDDSARGRTRPERGDGDPECGDGDPECGDGDPEYGESFGYTNWPPNE